MRKALQTLPCVETSSVTVEMSSKEARFTVKKDGTLDIESAKKVVKDAGYTVSAVKEIKAAKPKAADAKAPVQK